MNTLAGLSVGITGGSGLIGSELGPSLEADGAQAVRIGRSFRGTDGLDVIVHLAGEPIAARRWNATHKQKILQSRVEGTERLCAVLAASERRPQVLLSGSAVGYYGDRGDEALTEDSGPGKGFLSEVAQAWEAAVAPARELGIRVVTLRSGLVLSKDGGVLGAMLPAFRAGVGGSQGSGEHWQPWISMADWIAAAKRLMVDDTFEGPVNLVSPNPVRQRELAKTLGRVLRRPTVIPSPKPALRLVFGREMADEMLLASQRVLPGKLQAAGFAFALPGLEETLRSELG